MLLSKILSIYLSMCVCVCAILFLIIEVLQLYFALSVQAQHFFIINNK